MIPGWTTATRFAWSISRIRSIRVNAIVSAALDAGGAARQAGPGAARHDRHAMRRSPAARARATSAVVGRQGDGQRQARPQVRRSRRGDSLAVEWIGQEPEVGQPRRRPRATKAAPAAGSTPARETPAAGADVPRGHVGHGVVASSIDGSMPVTRRSAARAAGICRKVG